MSDILQNNWSTFFRSLKVMKDNERLKNCHGREGTKETTADGHAGSRAKGRKRKQHDGRKGWRHAKAARGRQRCPAEASASAFGSYAVLYPMELTSGEAGEKSMGTFCSIFATFL